MGLVIGQAWSLELVDGGGGNSIWNGIKNRNDAGSSVQVSAS